MRGPDAATPAARATLAELNAMPADAFVAVLGGVFERSPWVARRSLAARPFATVASLYATMVDAVRQADADDQLALLRAHPELAAREADLTDESRREQRGAGLDGCTREQRTLLASLNARYRERFGFPFILAVKGYDVEGILGEARRRLGRAPAEEREEALSQVARIARFRLDALVAG